MHEKSGDSRLCGCSIVAIRNGQDGNPWLKKMPLILEDAVNGLPGHLCQALALVYDEVRALERRVTDLDRQLAHVAKADPVAHAS